MQKEREIQPTNKQPSKKVNKQEREREGKSHREKNTWNLEWAQQHRWKENEMNYARCTGRGVEWTQSWRDNKRGEGPLTLACSIHYFPTFPGMSVFNNLSHSHTRSFLIPSIPTCLLLSLLYLRTRCVYFYVLIYQTIYIFVCLMYIL